MGFYNCSIYTLICGFDTCEFDCNHKCCSQSFTWVILEFCSHLIIDRAMRPMLTRQPIIKGRNNAGMKTIFCKSLSSIPSCMLQGTNENLNTPLIN